MSDAMNEIMNDDMYVIGYDQYFTGQSLTVALLQQQLTPKQLADYKRGWRAACRDDETRYDEGNDR
jgi:hypothetical protein